MYKSEVRKLSEKICNVILKKKDLPCGYTYGGECAVYLKDTKLTIAKTEAEKEIAMNDDSIVCIVAYYDSPSLKEECTVENIETKLIEALKDKGVIVTA